MRDLVAQARGDSAGQNSPSAVANEDDWCRPRLEAAVQLLFDLAA